MNRHAIVRLTIALALGWAGTAWSAPPANAAKVVVIQATGVGHPPRGMTGPRAKLMARRAAEVTAARNLQLKLDPSGRAPVPSFRYVATKYLAGGAVEVTVEAKVPAHALPKRQP